MSGDAELQGVDGLYTIYDRRKRPEEGIKYLQTINFADRSKSASLLAAE